MGGEGFEPPQPLWRLIYSQVQLSALPTAHFTKHSKAEERTCPPEADPLLAETHPAEFHPAPSKSQEWDSNPQPAVYKTAALPVELSWQEKVRGGPRTFVYKSPALPVELPRRLIGL